MSPPTFVLSLTCILCKVFEKVVRNHVMDHFLPFVSDAQHVFLKGKSCLSNLFECFDKIDEIVNGGGDVDILYLDFQKAFDTVPHNFINDLFTNSKHMALQVKHWI